MEFKTPPQLTLLMGLETILLIVGIIAVVAIVYSVKSKGKGSGTPPPSGPN